MNKQQELERVIKLIQQEFKCLVITSLPREAKCDFDECANKATWKLDLGKFCDRCLILVINSTLTHKNQKGV